MLTLGKTRYNSEEDTEAATVTLNMGYHLTAKFFRSGALRGSPSAIAGCVGLADTRRGHTGAPARCTQAVLLSLLLDCRLEFAEHY